MKLTEAERDMIHRRSHGEFSIIANCDKILQDHRKNRCPDDAPYISFLLHLKDEKTRDRDWDTYGKHVRAVWAAHRGDVVSVDQEVGPADYPEPAEGFETRHLECPSCNSDKGIEAQATCTHHDIQWELCSFDPEDNCAFGWVFWDNQKSKCPKCNALVSIRVDDDGACAVVD